MGATRLGAPSPPPPIAAFPDVAVAMDDGADDCSVEDVYEPPAMWQGGGMYDDQPAERKVSMDDVQEEKEAAAKDAKRQKELKKAIKDYMKTSLSSERTFFKVRDGAAPSPGGAEWRGKSTEPSRPRQRPFTDSD